MATDRKKINQSLEDLVNFSRKDGPKILKAEEVEKLVHEGKQVGEDNIMSKILGNKDKLEHVTSLAHKKINIME